MAKTFHRSLLACAVLLAVLAVPAQAAFPGQNGRLAFHDIFSSVYSIQPDGTGRMAITPGRDAAWSADGVFVASAAFAGDVCVRNLETGDWHCPVKGFGASGPAWSPDGRHIVFSAGGDLYRVERAGSALTRLTTTPAIEELDPAWSPDGQRIAFAARATPNGRFDLVTITPDGAARTPLTSTPVNEQDPNWSPDGSRLAFAAQPAADGDLEVYTAAASPGAARTRLTTAPGDDRGPAWSPDGSRIVFQSSRTSGNWDLWTMSADGTGQSSVTNSPSFQNDEMSPDWQPLVDRILTVNTTADVGDGLCTASHCTLREAIQASNARTGYDAIEFAIAGAGPHTIRPLSALPPITDAAEVDGTTQAGFAGAPVVEIDGSGAGPEIDGLVLASGTTTVRSLAVNGFSGRGIRISGAGRNAVTNCYLGVALDGRTAFGNAGAGLAVFGAAANRVGGNVISTTAGPGVVLSGTGADSNEVLGNNIGVSADGTTPFGRDAARVGVLVHNGASGNIIGDPEGRNRIHANAEGVVIHGSQTSRNEVVRNWIGPQDLDPALGNRGWGVRISDAAQTTVRDNRIAVNAAGVLVDGPAAAGTIVSGNGLNRNTGVGIRVRSERVSLSANGIQFSSVGIELDSDRAEVNGNTISSNRGHGVRILGSSNVMGNRTGPNNFIGNGGAGVAVVSGTANKILGGNFEENAGLGIDLAADGVTPNDPGDADIGPNERQNHPVLSQAIRRPDDTLVSGVLESRPNSTFNIHLSEAITCDPSGHGEGRQGLGSFQVTTNGSGRAEFTFAGAPATSVSRKVTATAVDFAGNTSEFSNCVEVVRQEADPILEVNAPDDHGDGACTQAHCSLREAMSAANVLEGLQRVTFDLPGGSTVIRPESELPELLEGVEIDGTTQHGYDGRPVVEIDGSLAGPGADGLRVRGGFSEVRGLAINRFPEDGLALVGARETTIAGNFIGTDVTGTQDRGNGETGIHLEEDYEDFGPPPVIGGSDPRDRNVVSGNDGVGVDLGTELDGVRVDGNFIGTDVSGTKDVGNTSHGVQVFSAKHVGRPGAGNVISGNGGNGIAFYGTYPFGGGSAEANKIGTDVTGTKPLGNNGDGINVDGDQPPGIVGNVVSANRGNGVVTGGTISANKIGTDVSGANPLGNGEWGVVKYGGEYSRGGDVRDNVISANGAGGINSFSGSTISGNMIGTDASGTQDLGNRGDGILRGPPSGGGCEDEYDFLWAKIERNTIVFNAGAAINEQKTCLSESSELRSNSMFSNNLLGIDLAGDGVTPNDPFDPDEGPNALQNFPVLSAIATDGSGTVVRGSLNSRPDEEYIVELFSSRACDPSGHGEGETPLDSFQVRTDSSGSVSFARTLPAPVPFGRPLTATATGSRPLEYGAGQAPMTSEFSPCARATADLSVQVTDSPDPVKPGEELTYRVTVHNAGPSEARGVSLEVTLPKHGGWGSQMASQGTCVRTKGAVRCALGALAAGRSANVTIRIKPTGKGIGMAIARVSAAQPPDPTPVNDSASATTRVGP